MNTNNKNSTGDSIGIFFSNLNDKEKSIFERVITFNTSHGLNAYYCDEISTANIIVANESNIPSFTQNNNAILLVIGKDKSIGNIQVAPPLLVTRVMKSIESAIKLLAQNKGDSADSNTEIAPQEQASNVDTSEKKYHALVIDDSASIRKQLELELRDAGITSDFAESGEQAIEKVKDARFDLIFLDIIMPGMDGYETCKAIRKNAEFKKTPIIMLSGKSSPLDEVEGVIAGATCYLIKPVKSDMLQQTLNRVTKWMDNYATPIKETETV